MTSRHRPPGVFRRTARAVAVGALALAGVTALPAANAQADATTSGDVIANLWSYNWDSVASECTDVLGPNGYEAVWAAPSAESEAVQLLLVAAYDGQRAMSQPPAK